MDNNSSNNQKLPTTYGLPKLREQVINVLEQAYIGNNLDADDYEQRLVLAHSAKSVEELKNVIHDFPQKDHIFPKSKAVTPRQTTTPTTTIDTEQLLAPVKGLIHSIENADSMSVIGDCYLSTFDLNQPNVKIVRGIGNAVIDLRDIGHKYSHVRIESYGLIGDVYIRVPMTAHVKRKMFLLLGEKTQRVRNKAKSFFDKLFGTKNMTPRYNKGLTAPEVTIEIVGFNLIGNLNIEYCPEESQ